MSCDCSEDFGPCEDHSVVLAQREGASTRTGDELASVFVTDVDDIRASLELPPVADQTDRAFLESVDGWLEDDDDVERLQWLRELAENDLPDGVMVLWEDGYRILRMTDDCPLMC